MNIGESVSKLVELEFKKRDVEKSIAYYTGWPIAGYAAAMYRNQLKTIEEEISSLRAGMAEANKYEAGG